MQHRGQLRWRATLLLIGTIIGAGIFGVPAMIGEWGIAVSTLAFAAITLLVLAAQLFYAEAVLANGEEARIEADAAKWLGKPVGAVAGAVQALQIFGSNLAYLILGGEFLAVLMRMVGVDVPLIVWQVVFWIVGSIIVCYGLAAVVRAEVYLTWFLIASVILLIFAFASRLAIEDVMRLGFTLPARFTFEPYGVILFALLGVTPIPEIVEVVKRKREDVFKAVIYGTVASAVLTYAFGVFGWLASGGAIGRDPSDVIRSLPVAIAFIVPIAGFLAIVTSYISTALDLRNMFHLDYHFSDRLAWLISLGVPIALLFLTPRDFLGTISFVGAVFGTMIAVIVALMGYAALSKGARKRMGLRESLWRQAAPVSAAALLLSGGIIWFLAS
jgi:amino acid permease